MRNYFIFCLAISFLIACSSNQNVTSKASRKSSLSEKDKVAFGRAYIDGSKEKILGNYEKSAVYYEKALNLDPYSAAANYELGLNYSYLAKNDLAFEQFKMATELEPTNYWYKLSYASSLRSKGEMEEAIQVFEQLVEENPTQLEMKYELSKLLLNQGRSKEGIEYLNQIEKEIGVTEDISFLKQRIYLSENNVEGAANEIKKLRDSQPDELKYYGLLAEIYLSNGRKDEAIEVYREMEKMEPDNYLVQFSLAEYYRSEGNQSDYWNAIQKAFANPKMNIDDKVKYVLTFYQIDSNEKEKKQEGIELCRTIVQAHPNNPKSYALYADFLYFDEQVEEAKEAYKKTIELDSSRFPVWNQLLVILSETNDIKALLNYGERAVNLFPNQPTLYLIYGLGLSQNKDHKKAIEYFELGKDIVFDNQALKSQFYSSIGDSYNELKDYPKSDENFDKALSIDPNNVFVLNNYSYYLSLRNENLEKAKEMSAKSNNLAPNQASFQDTYAWILYQLGNYENANEWLDKAMKSEGDVSDVLLEHKGDILIKLNKVEEAITFYNRAIEKGGNSEVLLEKINQANLND